MSSAIIGLLGVVVGAIITTGTQIWLERQKTNVGARRAKRLVYHELMQSCTALHILADEQVEPNVIRLALDQLLPKVVWDEYRPDLAGTLNDTDWQTLLNAYSMLEVLRKLLQTHGILGSQAPDAPEEAMTSLRATMKTSASNIEKSIAILAG